MIRKTVLVGVGAAVLLTAAGTAYAAESTNPAPAPAATATPAPGAHQLHGAFRGEYAQWTTYDATTRTKTVHDGIRGTVSAVSPTSITVTAVDGTAQTFAVNPATKVHEKGATTPTGALGQVKAGDRAAIVATGAATGGTAVRINDRGAAAPAH